MARRNDIEFTKTYASPENCEKALDKFPGIRNNNELRYGIFPVVVDGKVRYGILFYGMSAVQAGVHHHFNCVA